MPGELPFIDEFEVAVDAPVAAAFQAVCGRIGGHFEGIAGRFFTEALGCVHRGSSFTTPPAEGQEVNGFKVVRVVEPRELVLEGRHRFAAYRLSFHLEPAGGEERSRVRARTEAAFPGLPGSVYRALVIGSGAHAFVAKQILARVAAKAIAARRASG